MGSAVSMSKPKELLEEVDVGQGRTSLRHEGVEVGQIYYSHANRGWRLRYGRDELWSVPTYAAGMALARGSFRSDLQQGKARPTRPKPVGYGPAGILGLAGKFVMQRLERLLCR